MFYIFLIRIQRYIFYQKKIKVQGSLLFTRKEWDGYTPHKLAARWVCIYLCLHKQSFAHGEAIVFFLLNDWLETLHLVLGDLLWFCWIGQLEMLHLVLGDFLDDRNFISNKFLICMRIYSWHMQHYKIRKKETLCALCNTISNSIYSSKVKSYFYIIKSNMMQWHIPSCKRTTCKSKSMSETISFFLKKTWHELCLSCQKQ